MTYTCQTCLEVDTELKIYICRVYTVVVFYFLPTAPVKMCKISEK